MLQSDCSQPSSPFCPLNQTKLFTLFASWSSIYYFYKQTSSDFLAGQQCSVRHPQQVAQHRPARHQPPALPGHHPAPQPQHQGQQADGQLRVLRPGASHQVRGEAAGQEQARLERVLPGLRLQHEVQGGRAQGVTCGDSSQQ